MGSSTKRPSRRTLSHRRRVEDEGDDDGGPETLDHLDDDSVTEGSVVSDENDHADDSDTSNVDETSSSSPVIKKTSGRGASKSGRCLDVPTEQNEANGQVTRGVVDAEEKLNGLSISDEAETVRDGEATSEVTKSAGPVIVSSTPVLSQEAPSERRRREHDEYRKNRDEDPAFVPNRGAFFMHDHRHAGPAANGFRPFGRGAIRGGRGRGRGGISGPFAPAHSFQANNPFDPTVSAPWAHDMHETVADPLPVHQPRHQIFHTSESLPNGDGHIPTCRPSEIPINRHLSTEKTLGNVEVRVFFPGLKEPKSFSGIPIKRYTKLPDHRPPLRRDKPVRISLPDRPPRYVFPAVDRSFIFIPRAMRPNQQRFRGKARPGLGSAGGYSHRTSVYGGSYYGSVYTLSVDMSRRSSVAPADFISPTHSAMSRPVVRLPPMAQAQMSIQTQRPAQAFMPPSRPPVDAAFDATSAPDLAPEASQPSVVDMPQPQTHPLPQKLAFPETLEDSSASIPMHQPQPQKTVSVENIESPTRRVSPPQQYQQAFHQQVPPQVANSLSQDAHGRHSSYPSQISTGTPLSQIPERAIHAAPFQPSTYSQQPHQPQAAFYSQPYPIMPPQQGYYYQHPYNSNMAPPSTAASAFYSGVQPPPGMSYGQTGHGEAAPVSATGQGGGGSTLVAQDVNGTVYYYDASQIPTYPSYPSYNAGYVPGMGMGMGMGMSPGPDGYYYNQAPPGMAPY